ncbi:MAG: hypothetical protein JWM80_6089 [Cyanobacteria bacterium RYN_339]|nr:hypothetical protein [Cyanobacteria bacterium RYN_339]
MRRLLAWLPLLVVACQNVGEPMAKHGAAPAVASVAPTTTAKASKAPAVSPILARPGSPTVELRAKVVVDAAYIVAQGGGNIVANNGGNVLLTGDARLISDKGSGVISDHGAGLIGNNAGSRRVLAAQELLPAAGMTVQVTSLRTGKPLTLGMDAAGQPVLTTTTDLQGEVKVYIPKEEQGNVLVQAAVPGSADKRLQYGLVTATATTTTALVDEDTAQVSALLRVAIAGRIGAQLTQDPARALCEVGNTDVFPPAIKAALQQSVSELHAAALQAGVKPGPAADALALAMGDTVLANLDLGAIMMTPEVYPGLPRAEPMFPAMVEVMRHVRDQAARQLAQDPNAFAAKPYIVEGNSCKPGTYVIAKATDLNAFIVQEYLAAARNGELPRVRAVIDDVGARRPEGVADDQAVRLSAAASALEAVLGIAFVTDQNGAKSTALAQIKAFDPAKFGSARPLPCWQPTADELKGCEGAP